ncbi:MAG TPA: M1 family aminopeptidase, partial [Pyrinomonadaceae bacterium]|nr:M1 family aminopeptidase [Pyrinomonadaceae bacterium]
MNRASSVLFTLLGFFLLMSAVNAQTPPIEPGVSHELARWRAARYSEVRYKLNLTLEKMSPVLKGTIEVRVRIVGEKGSKGEGESAVGPIVLDWRKIKGHEDKSAVSNVSINGSPAKYEESNEHLIFRDGVVGGENVIKLDFTSPILASGSAITRYIDKEDGSEYIYSLFVPSDASTAFPVFDQPDLKAKFSLTLDAPKEWTVVSNTIPGLGREDSRGSFYGEVYKGVGYNFAETQPISTYVFAFAAGNFAQLTERDADTAISAIHKKRTDTAIPVDALYQEMGAHIFLRKSQLAKFQPHAAEVFRLNREGIKFLEEYFNYKFPFPKYDLVLIPEFPFGGMEHAGATFLREAAVIFPSEPTANDHISRANLIFHEAAHQWFGDTVTMRWFDDLWLKEGFAEFMAYKTLERVMPQYNAWKVFYERNKQAAYFTDSTKGTTPIYQEIKNLSAAKSAYGNIVYRKAPSFLKQAEFYLGADKFQRAVRSFLKK